jgi:rod shape-determining protein MreB
LRLRQAPIKIEIRSAWQTREQLKMEVRGRFLRAGRPRVVSVDESEVREALSEPLKVIVQAVKEALDTIPPEIASDVMDRGVVLTGGGALLRGLDERLRRDTGVPIIVADDPLTSVVRGAGMMLEDFDLLKRVAMAA